MSNNENSSQLKSSIDESLMNNEKKRKNKSLQPYKRERKTSVEVRTKFKISEQHLGFLIE